MQTALMLGISARYSKYIHIQYQQLIPCTVIVLLTCAVHMRAAPMPSIADIVYSKYTFSINNCAIKPSDIDH